MHACPEQRLFAKIDGVRGNWVNKYLVKLVNEESWIVMDSPHCVHFTIHRRELQTKKWHHFTDILMKPEKRRGKSQIRNGKRDFFSALTLTTTMNGNEMKESGRI